MSTNLLLGLAQKVVTYFWESPEVKNLVITLLERYAASTDNDVDNLLVDVVRSKLIRR